MSIRRSHGRARRLGSAVLTILGDSLSDAVIDAINLTSTGLAIVTTASQTKQPGAVIKIAMTAGAQRALERETSALAALHGEERLGTWREFLPQPLAEGTADGHRFRVDSMLAGRPAEHVDVTLSRARMLDMAAEVVTVLHRATATTLRGTVTEVWVDAHLDELTRYARRRQPLASHLDLLRAELHEALAGQAFVVGWIHGDYWLGNVVWGGAGPADAAPAGIVDWEAASPFELALHDLLHLVMYARRLQTGRELGQIVRDRLRGAEWSEQEQIFLRRFGALDACGALSERHCLLLYWLRQVAMHARQQTWPVGYRYRLWEQRNIVPVLTAL